MIMDVYRHEQDVTMDELQRVTAATALYTSLPRAQALAVLRFGIIEETMECVELLPEVPGGPELTDEARLELEGEISDVWWYLAETPRCLGLPAHDITDRKPIRAFQSKAGGNRLPVLDHTGYEITLQEDCRTVLGVTVLRIVDILNPKMPQLWRGVRDEPRTIDVMADLARATAYVANEHGIDIASGVAGLIRKLESRPRKPHAIDKADLHSTVGSERTRMAVISPWLTSLLVETGMKQPMEFTPAY